jgi:hypothetical protein
MSLPTKRLFRWRPHVAVYSAHHESIHKRDQGEQLLNSRINERIRLF